MIFICTENHIFRPVIIPVSGKWKISKPPREIMKKGSFAKREISALLSIQFSGVGDTVPILRPRLLKNPIRYTDAITDIPAISAIETEAFESHAVHPRIMFSAVIKSEAFPQGVMHDCY